MGIDQRTDMKQLEKLASESSIRLEFGVAIRLLYDSSGGIGKEIHQINKPFDGFYTRYAGGINPETVNKIAYNVELTSGNTPVYIDMEIGIRTDNWFCINKCGKIIDAVNTLKMQLIWEN
jgi:hypothetical protein